jgi:hypothetical protein
MIIPPGYGDKLAAGQTAEVAFVVDGSDPSIAGVALSAAQLSASFLGLARRLTSIPSHLLTGPGVLPIILILLT